MEKTSFCTLLGHSNRAHNPCPSLKREVASITLRPKSCFPTLSKWDQNMSYT
jgi:hypothetical protein